jgi:hypothetical protein
VKEYIDKVEAEENIIATCLLYKKSYVRNYSSRETTAEIAETARTQQSNL